MLRALIFVSIALAASSAEAARPCETALVPFEIEDQFEAKHTESEFLDHVSVLVWFDRSSRENAQKWFDALHAGLRGQVDGDLVRLRMVGHTKGAPFFIKGRIRGSFSEQPADWVLLDWKGIFQKTYAPPSDHATVLVFDPDGCLRTRAAVAGIDAQVLARLISAAQQPLIEAAEDSP